jgi:hypothetical protein
VTAAEQRKAIDAIADQLWQAISLHHRPTIDKLLDELAEATGQPRHDRKSSTNKEPTCRTFPSNS